MRENLISTFVTHITIPMRIFSNSQSLKFWIGYLYNAPPLKILNFSEMQQNIDF